MWCVLYSSCVVNSTYYLVTSFGRAAFSYEAVQPPFDILTSPGFGSPCGNYFTPVFVCSQHTAPRNKYIVSNLHGHSPLRVPNHTLVEWNLYQLTNAPRYIVNSTYIPKASWNSCQVMAEVNYMKYFANLQNVDFKLPSLYVISIERLDRGGLVKGVTFS